MPDHKLEPVPAPPPSPRIDTSLAVRAGAIAVQTDGSRVGQILGRHWSTEASETEAIELCSLLAEDALRLRRTILAARKMRDEA
jgi:hypothetical protein